MQRDPVAESEHLARDLGVQTLGWVDERRVAEPQEIERGRDDGDAEEEPPHRTVFPSGNLHDRVARQPTQERGERLLEIAGVA